ncbi:MAG: molybdopterin-dependent oxidoreductase [Epsilonproteobacteria bacterium]|nr:molybdopterin-dependent oxidoreductase [Campylobacterota bacterium]
MAIEISRRKFLQGSVALSVIGGTSIGVSPLFSEEEEHGELSITTKTGTGKAKLVPTLCEMCVNKCAAIARVENGIVTKLDPNPMFPKSKNMLCPRGNAGIQALYDPDRLKYPMIRVGEKGEGKFKRVTWDEAYNAILNGTDKFPGMAKILDEEQDNRSSFLFCAGEGMAEHTFKTFYSAFGSSNWLNHSSVCLQTVSSAYSLTLGAYPGADLKNATYVIMAGANRAEAIVTPDTMTLFKKTKGRGTKLVCIDPRFTNTAAKADKWLPINPGTDLAFVLALTYVVLKEELYNKEYVEANFNDFEIYKDHIISHGYTPEWASKITMIPAKEIYTIAREFMQHAPKAIYYPGRRSTFAANDFQLRRAMAIFQALGGGIDTKGGLVFGKKLELGTHEGLAPLYFQAASRAVQEVDRGEGKPGYDDCAIVTEGGSWLAWRDRFLEKRMPYKVRGMFVYKHNPVLNMPNTKKSIDMMKRMELTVVIDTMPSDTVMYADVVLPECTYLERTDPVKTFGGVEPSIAQRNKVIEPMYESKPVIEILRGLTEKISKPLFEITKKYDMDVQDMVSKIDNSAIDTNTTAVSNIAEDSNATMAAAPKSVEDIFAEFDISLPFKESQEKINEHMVHELYGEEGIKALKEHGVFYPNMKQFFKQVSANEFQYYPENEKAYSVNNGAPKTESGKVECNLAFLAEKGIDPMPTWKNDFAFVVPEGKFRMLTGRHAQYTQTGTANNSMLHDLMHSNYIWINKRVADKMDIEFGDEVEVSSSTGKVTIKAYPTEQIAPNVVFFIHGFGSQSEALTWAYKNGACDNTVITDKVEPMYGAAAMHETNVEIRKV